MIRKKYSRFILCGLLAISTACTSNNRPTPLPDFTTPKPATDHTINANIEMAKALNFEDKQDFKSALRGFIARPETLTIKSDDDPNLVVWDLEEYKKYISLYKRAPDTVNPSLWRNTRLNLLYGLFKVTDKIYQVRGYDLSNITFVESSEGWIVLDPLISPETARAALNLINDNRDSGPLKVAAIIYSHSHLDHYGGASGLFENDSGELQEELLEGVEIIAPEGFTEHAVSENVIAGNAMGRRAVYMYGSLLPRNEKGGVNGGLGMTTSTGVAGLLLPTMSIKDTGKIVTIGDIKMEFQMTPGTEAPAEMNTWFEGLDALWMAENTTNTMHNILTLRGALVRDPLIWAKYLNETIEKWGEKAKVKFQSHHWPLWDDSDSSNGNEIVNYLKKQRDIYKFTHDQSVRLMNKGYTGEEISEMITLPESLEKNWATRGYYGTLRHNSRAVYQRYMGWYDGHPSSLNNLPPEQVAKKYIRFMGGEKNVIDKAKKSFDRGEYRWVAEVMKHAVFNNPKSEKARALLADALEQLGYQAESGPWRSVYLQGAHELRYGVPESGGLQTATPETIQAMSPEMILDYLAIRIDSKKAEGKDFRMNLKLENELDKMATTQSAYYGVTVENAVLNYGALLDNPNITLTMSQSTLNDIMLDLSKKDSSLWEIIQNHEVNIEGEHPRKELNKLSRMLDTFDFWFHIVTP